MRAAVFQLMGEATATAEYSSRVIKTANDILEKINLLEKDIQKHEVQNRSISYELASVKRQLTAKTKQSNALRREVDDLKASAAKHDITLSSDEDFNKTLASIDALS